MSWHYQLRASVWDTFRIDLEFRGIANWFRCTIKVSEFFWLATFCALKIFDWRWSSWLCRASIFDNWLGCIAKVLTTSLWLPVFIQVLFNKIKLVKALHAPSKWLKREETIKACFALLVFLLLPRWFLQLLTKLVIIKLLSSLLLADDSFQIFLGRFFFRAYREALHGPFLLNCYFIRRIIRISWF